MILNKEPNPLNVFKARRVNHPLPHFEYVNVPIKYNLEGSLDKWIDRNLKNRYFIGKNVSLDKNNSLSSVLTVGFEEKKDMSYFMLACPHLKYT